MDAAFFYLFCFFALSGKSLPVRVALNLRSLDSLVTSLRIRRPRFECEVTITSAKRTVKRTIRQINIPEQHTQCALNQFKLWYNHIRPHQSLQGHTPAEVWSGKPTNQQGINHYFNIWEGVLTGYYLPPD